MDPFLNQVLCQRYKLRARLSHKPGRRTFVATDLQTDTTVVVKLLLFDLEFTWENLKLFERESAALQSLDHPAIPQYLDFVDIETDQGKGFLLVQTYIEAKSLEEWVTAGRTFSETDLHHIAHQILDILEYLHSRQPAVIHRDLKPSNLLLTERSGHDPGQLYLVDFGGIQAPQQGSTITIVGTYGYMPLEQFGGRAIPASDIYSLGCTIIYLATGQHPADLPQADLRIQFAEQVNLSPSFTQWLQWLTAADVSKRPPSAQVARDRFHQPPGSPPEHHPLRVPPPKQSAIQLAQTPDQFNIQVPNDHLKFDFHLLHYLTRWVHKPLGTLGITLSVLVFLFLLSTGLIWPFLILGGVLSYRFREKRKRSSFSLIFERDTMGTALSFLEIYKGQEKTLFKQTLKSITAGPERLPKYQINIQNQGMFSNLHIHGSYQEIRWLCDELDGWTELPITYHDPSKDIT